MPSKLGRITIVALAAAGILATPVAGAQGPGAEVRFVHAVPGVDPAVLSVAGTEVGSAGFAEATQFAPVPAGEAELALAVPKLGTLTERAELAGGRAYTVVAMAGGETAELLVFEDEPAVAGKARLRMIHASAELGVPDVELGGEMVATGAEYQEATKYWTLSPGDYELRVENPEDGKPVLEPQRLALAAGTSSSAVIVGGGGEMAQTLLLSDSISTPSAAPASGFGGLGGGEGGSVGLALAAALLAGALGATAWLFAMRTRAGRAGRGA